MRAGHGHATGSDQAGYAHAGKEFLEILALHKGASLVKVLGMKNRGQ